MGSMGQRWSFQYLNRIILFMKLYSGLLNFFFSPIKEVFLITFKQKLKHFYFSGTRFQPTSWYLYFENKGLVSELSFLSLFFFFFNKIVEESKTGVLNSCQIKSIEVERSKFQEEVAFEEFGLVEIGKWAIQADI